MAGAFRVGHAIQHTSWPLERSHEFRIRAPVPIQTRGASNWDLYILGTVRFGTDAIAGKQCIFQVRFAWHVLNRVWIQGARVGQGLQQAAMDASTWPSPTGALQKRFAPKWCSPRRGQRQFGCLLCVTVTTNASVHLRPKSSSTSSWTIML